MNDILLNTPHDLVATKFNERTGLVHRMHMTYVTYGTALAASALWTEYGYDVTVEPSPPTTQPRARISRNVVAPFVHEVLPDGED